MAWRLAMAVISGSNKHVRNYLAVHFDLSTLMILIHWSDLQRFSLDLHLTSSTVDDPELSVKRFTRDNLYSSRT